MFGRSLKPLAVTAVVLAAALPYLSTIPGYFLSDDFGLYQLFSQKPWWHVFTLFTNPWWEEIYGFRGDELRPTVAFSYQMDGWISGMQPWMGHVSNIVFHVLCALLVYAMARGVAGLPIGFSALAGAVFGVMAVHGEPVAWISGRADSIPTIFYLATVVAYARWRGDRRRRWYWLSVVAFFWALFSKQSAITMLAALVLYDLLLTRQLAWKAYLPFAAMIAAYLGLRLHLFGNAVREQSITWERIEVFWDRQDVYLQMMAAGVQTLADDPFGLVLAALMVVLLAAGALRPWQWLYFAPAWWLVTVAPMVVTYVSARHLYLPSAGIAVAVAMGSQALWNQERLFLRYGGLVLAAGVFLGQFVALGEHVDRWNAAAKLSAIMTRDIEREALSLPPGSLVLIGAPPAGEDPRRWAWVWGHSIPFTVQPPFLPAAVEERVSFVSRAEVYCCGYGNWYTSTRNAVAAWAERPDRPPAVAFSWDLPSGELIRRSDPALRQQALRLRDAPSSNDLYNEVHALLHPLGGTGARFRVN